MLLKRAGRCRGFARTETRGEQDEEGVVAPVVAVALLLVGINAVLTIVAAVNDIS